MTDAGVSRRRDWRLVELGRSNRREDGKRRDAATENENKTKQKRRRASTTDAEEACDLRREKRSVVDRRKIGRAAANTFAKKKGLPNRQKKGKKENVSATARGAVRLRRLSFFFLRNFSPNCCRLIFKDPLSIGPRPYLGFYLVFPF